MKSDKCNWRLIDWEESSLGWKLREITDMSGTLSMWNYETNEREEIERLQTDVARETFGVLISPYGSWEDQQVRLNKMMNEFTSRLKTSNLCGSTG